MGMYDEINFEMDCPKCGEKLDSFQSKSGLCTLATLEFWEVDKFYDYCGGCKAWIEFNRKAPREKPTLDDYEMEVR